MFDHLDPEQLKRMFSNVPVGKKLPSECPDCGFTMDDDDEAGADWVDVICGECGGSGEDEEGEMCWACDGECYDHDAGVECPECGSLVEYDEDDE